MSALAIDLGGTNLRAGLAMDDAIEPTSLGRWNAPASLDEFRVRIEALLVEHEASELGVCIPGLAHGTLCAWVPNLPFLDGGRSRANYQAALSRVQQAYINWQSVVRSAIEETENALAAVLRDGRSIDAATKVKDSATRQLEMARASYEAGQSEVLDLLTAERQLFDARTQLASATLQYAKNYVRLNVALGGGVMALAVN